MGSKCPKVTPRDTPVQFAELDDRKIGQCNVWTKEKGLISGLLKRQTCVSIPCRQILIHSARSTELTSLSLHSRPFAELMCVTGQRQFRLNHQSIVSLRAASPLPLCILQHFRPLHLAANDARKCNKLRKNFNPINLQLEHERNLSL